MSARYRAEKASGGAGADVIDTEAKPMRQVIARCGTLGQARVIVDALTRHRGAVEACRRAAFLIGALGHGGEHEDCDPCEFVRTAMPT